MSLVERVEPVGHAVAQGDGAAADRFGDGGVLALGVTGDVDAAAERDRAGVEALGEAGLAGADDAGEDEVRCGDQAAGVEDPRVVYERAPGVQVLTDEHALAAETSFGEERIGAGQRRGRVLVARHPEAAGRAQCRRSRFARAGERDSRTALSGELVRLPLRLGPTGFSVLRHPSTRGSLPELAILSPFPAGRNED